MVKGAMIVRSRDSRARILTIQRTAYIGIFMLVSAVALPNAVQTATGYPHPNPFRPQQNILGSSAMVGSSDFQEIIDGNLFIVDKTLFVKEFVEDLNQVVAILRPRRFGKSTNLSMLKAFLSIGAKPEQFDRFKIAQHVDFVSQHCGKYPVLYVDLKECKARSLVEMLAEVWECMRMTAFDVLKDCFQHPEICKPLESLYLRFQNDSPSLISIKGSLAILVKLLFIKFGKKVIVLIDEYDTPLNYAHINGFYAEASDFFGYFFSRALKGNPEVHRACMVGIVEMRGAGILSGLNHLKVFSVADEKYSQYFGFTREEIRAVLNQDEMRETQVMDWYNGYIVGSTFIINPWSFMNWLISGKFDSFWVQTSYVGGLLPFIQPFFPDFFVKILLLLSKDAKVSVSPLRTRIDHSFQAWSQDSILHFLVMTGYLTYSRDQTDDSMGWVSVPNFEILKQWNEDVMGLVRAAVKPKFHARVEMALMGPNFNSQLFQDVIAQLVMSGSYLDYRSENSYHVLIFGFLYALLEDKENLSVKSNIESGIGRFDIRFVSQVMKRAVFIELKKSKEVLKLEIDAEAALRQIDEANCAFGFGGFECVFVGISFHSKQTSTLHCRVRKCNSSPCSVLQL
jgi:hypothetical protein